MGRAVIELAAEISMKTGNVPCLIGYTGVGKTDMGSIIADRNKRKLTVLNLAVQSTEDLVGYPYRGDDNKMHWAPPAWFPNANEENTYLIYVDEINRASKDVINAIMPMLLNGTLHEHTLPKGTWLLAAMNPDNNDFDMVNSFDDAAILSRLILIEVPPDFTSWKAWLKERNMHDDAIVNFLETHRTHFVPHIQNVLNQNIKPNPRSWTKLITILDFCKKENIKPLPALDLICRGMLGSETNTAIAMLLETYFGGKTILDTLNEPITDENALSNAVHIMNEMTPNFKHGDMFVNWFVNCVNSHPTIANKLLFEINPNIISEYYTNVRFMTAINQLLAK